MRLVQVGLGSWGSSWVDVVRLAPGIELAGVADLSADVRERAQAELGLPVLPSLEAALEATDAEAVLVASPPPSHHDVATAALERGRHVLTEKPLATSLAEGRSLVAAADRAQRTLMARTIASAPRRGPSSTRSPAGSWGSSPRWPSSSATTRARCSRPATSATGCAIR